ncbi:MAG: hydroxymethylbilane synthase [Methanosphaera sp.]|uniref:hydroxymethylbilane synthase n=1 Tax=Methanosphaera sp. TaxID=2666342 RepID=UPI0025FB7C80|nr:hydroxymethylbilane synthase [Methanosphaera sp.]MCI5867450.1 hydroxymethylbilane synthase [Methanosphaera sp.]MDD6534482.1 hydroxymethylbilane synthase [Methanosphaera sp.]MDY3955849.1 hydroxymethylbilane synthase [Methanosphaera sp.]
MIVGTRGSQLATTQTGTVVAALEEIIGEEIETKIIKTTGDKIKDTQLYNFDAKGIFTKELDIALINNDIDFAVHSFKDLPSELNDQLQITAIPQREAVNEVLISNYSWDELPDNATIGTSSLRREAFCKYHGKNIKTVPLRGNVETRIRKVLEDEVCDATIMAAAGINRLGLQENIKEIFDETYIVPPAGQGALAIMTNKDSEYNDVIAKLNHENTRIEALCEKTILETLGVGCQWPIGITSKVKGNNIDIHAKLLTPEGGLLSDIELTDKKDNAIDAAKEIGMKLKEESL